jgi:Domain of unknown function (DUF222)
VIARRILDQLDPDGTPPLEESDDPCPAAGELRIRDRRDGGISLEGWFDALHGIAFRALIKQLATPRPLTEDIPDPRTQEQRNADALVELCDLACGNDHMLAAGGEPPHVTVTLDYQTLLTELAGAALDYGQRLSATQARLAACDCKIIPVVMGGNGEPLYVGRARRTVRSVFAGRWSPATADVPSRAVTDRWHCVTPITFANGTRRATPRLATVSCSAPCITAGYTPLDGTSPFAETSSSSSHSPFSTPIENHSPPLSGADVPHQ